jgi:hypothetical protein
LPKGNEGNLQDEKGSICSLFHLQVSPVKPQLARERSRVRLFAVHAGIALLLLLPYRRNHSAQMTHKHSR